MIDLVFPDELIDSQFSATLEREQIFPAEELYPLDASGDIVRFAVMSDRPGEKSGAYYLHADGFPNWGVMEYGRHDGMVQDKFRFDRLTPREQDILRDANPQTRPYAATRDAVTRRPATRDAVTRRPATRDPQARLLSLRQALRAYRDGVAGDVVMTHPFVRRKFTERGVDLTLMCGFNLWGTGELAENAPRVSSLTGNLLFPLLSPVTGMFHGLHWVGTRNAQSGRWAKGFVSGTAPKGAAFRIRPDGARVGVAYVCEGIATGLALSWLLWRQNRETFTVYCALSAGNIVPLCTALKQSREVYVIVAADNDAGTAARTGKNAGLLAAESAKQAFVADRVEVPELGKCLDNLDYYDLLFCGS